MTSITQTIPSLIGGISQQPEQLMLPGTVKNLDNLIPDITEGLVKRPSSQYVNSLTGATSTGVWFSYYRDQSEGAYIGQVQRNGSVNVWRVSDGSPQQVTGSASSYLTHTSISDLKFLTVADTTFVTNTTKTVSHRAGQFSPTRGASVGRSAEHYQAFVELRQVSHGREYSFDVASPTAVDEFVNNSNRGVVTKISLGDKTDSPFYQPTKTNPVTDPTGEVVTIDRNASVNSGANTYQGLDPELPYQGTGVFEINNGSAPGSGMVVRLTVTGQVNLSKYAGENINGDEYVGLYNTNVELLHGGNDYAPSDVTVVLKGVTHTIKIEEVQPVKTKKDLGTYRPKPTSFDPNHTISPDTILDLDKADAAITPHVQKIGNGFFLSHETAFNVTTTQPDLWRITSTEVNDVSELPRQCKHGMVVKVVNSSESQEDDFYLKFVGENDLDGPGKWEETIEPGRLLGFDTDTLPILIQRQQDINGNITFNVSKPLKQDGTVAWEDRYVGDDNTNPFPTFLGKKISQTFFHRNRLGFLCEDNIILSQADEIYNFFNNTALVVSGNDPIDIQSSSTQPTKFVDCIETNTGLVVFGETQQFMLHTDSDSLTPDTAKLSNISTYRYSPQTTPISLGTTIGFLDTAGSYSRFFEMFDIKREGEPQLVDVTKVVSKLLPSGIDILSISRENNTIFFSEKGERIMYLYRYFNTGSERLQGSWFRWDFPFDIAYTFVLDDNLYLVDTSYKLYVLNLQPQILNQTINGYSNSPSDLFTTTTYDKYALLLQTQIHLDAAQFLTAGAYNSTDNTTAVSWPNYIINGIFSRIYVYAVDANTGEIFKTKSRTGTDFTFHGNFAGNAIIIGYAIDAMIEFPTLYVNKQAGNKVTSDVTASLIIQRMHFHFEHVSSVLMYSLLPGSLPPGYRLDEFAKDVTPLNRYESDKPLGDAFVKLTIPIYQRNTTVRQLLFSQGPGPFSLTSVTWEGDYTPMNHKRV